MPRQLDSAIGEVLRGYGYNGDACWDCHGTWVVYHKICEQIAAKAGIKFDPPQIIRAERDEAVILVTGFLGDKREWSFGEALINSNYKVAGKQAAYPYAMAEKRAKDRVILKLIGLHGLAYSEEEADEFRGGPKNGNGNGHHEPGGSDAEAYIARAESTIEALTTDESVKAWWKNGKPDREAAGLTDDQTSALYNKAMDRRRVIAFAQKVAA